MSRAQLRAALAGVAIGGVVVGLVLTSIHDSGGAAVSVVVTSFIAGWFLGREAR